MPYQTNSPIYQTKYTRVTNFNDFENHIVDEEDELKKVKRSFKKNDDNVYNLPNVKKYKYNRVTRKMDDDSEPEIDDSLDSIDIKRPDHKYKLVSNNSQTTKLEESVIKFSDFK